MWTTVMLHLRSRTFICLHAPLSSFQRSDLASNTVSECFLLSVERLLANVSIQIWSVDLYLCSHYTDGWSLQCRRFCCAGCKAAMLKEICQLVPACGAIPLGFVSPGSRCGDCTGLTRLSITGEHGTSAERREWGLLQSSGRGTLINIQRLAGAVIATHADDFAVGRSYDDDNDVWLSWWGRRWWWWWIKWFTCLPVAYGTERGSAGKTGVNQSVFLSQLVLTVMITRYSPK